MSPILLAIALLLLILLVYNFVTAKPSKNFPPGPLRAPVLGGYFQVLLENFTYPHIGIQMLAKKHKSPLLGLYFGNYPVVVANTYETCKEIWQRPEFQARVDGLIPRTRAFGGKLGLFFDEGSQWQHQRRFTLRKLRDFGFGRRSDEYEGILNEEVKDCIDELKASAAEGDGTVALLGMFYPVMVNSIFHLLQGTRLPFHKREDLKAFGKVLMRLQNSTDAFGRLISIMPAFKDILPNSMTGFTDFVESSNFLWDHYKQQIDGHKQSFDPETLRDFIDTYLSDIIASPGFTEDQLAMCLVDLTFPVSTLAGVVVIAIMFVLENPQVLEKCHEELDAVVGRGRLPTLSDRVNLPYTEATLRETLRKASVAPMGVFHACMENTRFFGYDIPAGTIMATNIYAMHNDSELWGDPENFRPDRFLDNRGNIKRKDYTLPFGVGKRVCAGETFSRQNLFLTIAGVFQNFNFHRKTECLTNELISGFIINPPADFQVKLTVRE